MRDFVLMVDVNGDIDPEYAAAEDIKIMPQYYHFNDGVTYGDEIKLSAEEFYNRCKSGERAYSAGCNYDRVYGIMEEAVKAEKDIIVVMASSDCSGSYSTVKLAGDDLMEQYPGSRIYVVDSRLESVPIGLLCRMGNELRKGGKSFDEVVAAIENKKGKCDVFFIVNHLDYLVRGGRLSAFSGAMGTLLSIKPILHFEEGKIVPFMKCRGMKAAKQAILDYLKTKELDKEFFAGGYTLDKEPDEEYVKLFEDEIGVKSLWIAEVNHTIGSHTGDGALGVACCFKD